MTRSLRHQLDLIGEILSDPEIDDRSRLHFALAFTVAVMPHGAIDWELGERSNLLSSLRDQLEGLRVAEENVRIVTLKAARGGR